VTPQGPQVTAPGAPSIGTASAAVGGASISWTAPASDGGDAITSYQVDVLDGSDAVIKTVTVAAPATSVMVSGLTPGTTVRFRVSAINGAGTSVSSTTSNAVTVIGDVVAPTVSSRTPRPGAHHVARGAHVVVTFSERVSAVNARTFTLTNLANHKVVKATVTLSADGRTATLKPAARLTAGHHFRVQLTNGVRDMSANRLAATTWNFTT
jgi:hypothetical protein